MATVARPQSSGAVGLTVLLAAMILLNYVDRGALGIAAPKLKEELALDATSFGLAVSAFSWIYAPAQFAVGWLTSRVCIYRLVALGLLIWAAATTMTGFATGLATLVGLRVLLGIGEGVAFPAVSAIIARHVPTERRGLANSVVNSSLAFGPAVGTLVGGLILASYGWRPVFLIFGLITFLWLIPWMLASKPHWARANPDAERVRMAEVLREPTSWLTGFAHFFNTYGFYFVLAWLPLYLVKERGFSILEMTELLTAVYVLQGVMALVVGWLSDRLCVGRDEGKVRRTLMALGLAGVAMAIVGIAYSQTTSGLAFWLLFSGVAFSPGGAQAYSIAQIYAGKRASGPFVGVMNGIGNISGILGPIVTGMIVDALGYHTAFLAAAAVPAVGALVWGFLLPPIRPRFEAKA